MRLVRRMFDELYVSSFIMLFFDSFFTGLFFFSMSCMLLSFLQLRLIYGLVPAGVFFLYSMIKKIRLNKVNKLEEEYPQLREKLRTSKDYKDEDNAVVSALHTEVINLVNQADINALLNKRRLFLKVSGIAVFFFVTLMLSAAGFTVMNIYRSFGTNPIDMEQIRARANMFRPDKGLDMTTEYLENGSVAELGQDELNLSLDIYDTEIDITDIKKPEEKEFGDSFPVDPDGAGQEIFDEKISDEHKDVIKNYFDKIRG